jgi:hypothetical protein
MTNQSNRIWISCLVIGVAACLCLSVIGLGAAGYLAFNPTPRLSQQTTPAPQSEITRSATPGSASPTGQLSTSLPTLQPSNASPTATATYAPVSPQIARQMDQIQQQVSQITGLQAHEPITRVLITPAQLAQRVASDFAKQNDPKEILTNEIELIAWGLIKPDFDFNNYMERLQIEEIAGFYDDKTKDMFVVSGEGFGGYEKFTYAHEYTHALQDQNFDIEHGLNYNDQSCKKDTERCAAVQALLEGDAVLSQYNWLSSYATAQDKQDILKYASSLNLPLYDQAPDFLKQDFNFPYQQGLDFVQYLYGKGGWSAIDQAFKNPPVSTSQILHPELYPNQKPITVTLPDLGPTLGPDWSEMEQNTLGEWYTYLILAHGIDAKTRLDDNTAKTAAQGWAGDTYATYYNEQTKSTVIVLETTWDSAADTQQFVSAFQQYADDRFGNPTVHQADFSAWSSNGVYTELHTSGNKTIWIYAPDANSAQAIWKTLQTS